MRPSKITMIALASIGAFLSGPPPAGAADATDPLGAALEARILGKAPLDDVEIEASWQREPGYQTTRIWGTGLGIWQDRRIV